MEPLFDFGLEATRSLQASYAYLDAFFKLLSSIGSFEFYLATLPLIYWCLDKRLGITLTYLLAISDTISNTFKHALRDPRPYWLDPNVGLSTEDSYGFPSGHTQSVTVAYFYLAAWFRQGWIWVMVTLMTLFMILSRVYLGVHFVHDAIAGVMIGSLILGGYFVWHKYLSELFKKRILGQRLLITIAVPIFFLSLYVSILLLIGEPNMLVAWADFIATAEQDGMQSMATAIGLLFGLGVGFIFEGSRVRFLVDGPVWQRVLRYLLGIMVTIAIWRGLGLLFPRDPLWLALPLRMARYLLLGLWASYYAPMLFVRLGLANAKPKPEIVLTL